MLLNQYVKRCTKISPMSAYGQLVSNAFIKAELETPQLKQYQFAVMLNSADQQATKFKQKTLCNEIPNMRRHFTISELHIEIAVAKKN